MNLLKHRPPSDVEFDGIFYKIDPRYDTALAILDCMADELFPPHDRVEMALNMFYVDEKPEDDQIALALMFAFLDGKELSDCDPDEEPKASDSKLLDFDMDGNAIYTAFMRLYHIDLQETPIHWWKFQAMMQDISETCLLQTVLRVRTINFEDVPEGARGKLRALKQKFSLENKNGTTNTIETLEERNRRWKEG